MSSSPGLSTLCVFHLGDVTGPGRSLRPRLEALARRGTLDVLAPSAGSLAAAYGDLAEVRTAPYEVLTVPRGPRQALAAFARLGSDVRLFRSELRRTRPDLVVVVTAVLPAALIAARREGIPTIVYVGEIFSKGHVRGAARSLGGRAVARFTERLADRLVCCSRTVSAQFSDEGRAVTIYPGISSAYAAGDGDAFRARHGLDAAQPLVAVVGNVCSARGQDTAVQAVPAIRRHLPGAKLVIVGEPHPRRADQEFAREVRGLARTLDVEDDVVFAGFVERSQDVYAAADVVVNPARFNEPFGRAALEALMAGRPVVASSVGAIPEVLRDGRDVLLVPRDDPAALAEAVVRVSEDPELASRLVAEGRGRVLAEFGEQKGVEAFERVVDAVLAERGMAAPAPAGEPELVAR